MICLICSTEHTNQSKYFFHLPVQLQACVFDLQSNGLSPSAKTPSDLSARLPDCALLQRSRRADRAASAPGQMGSSGLGWSRVRPSASQRRSWLCPAALRANGQSMTKNRTWLAIKNASCTDFLFCHIDCLQRWMALWWQFVDRRSEA